MNTLTDLLDKTLDLKQKDEYETAATILQNIIVSLIHIRPKQVIHSSVRPCVHMPTFLSRWAVASVNLLQLLAFLSVCLAPDPLCLSRHSKT